MSFAVETKEKKRKEKKGVPPLSGGTPFATLLLRCPSCPKAIVFRPARNRKTDILRFELCRETTRIAGQNAFDKTSLTADLSESDIGRPIFDIRCLNTQTLSTEWGKLSGKT